jgi:DNA-binding CsgD family transcriptional regulator
MGAKPVAIIDSDQADLVLPLFRGLMDDAPWDVFLARLLARTGADRVHLFDGDAAAAPRWYRRLAAGGLAANDGAAELRAIGGPDPSLRPNRVYALEELQALAPAERAAQGAALAVAEIADARLMRIGAAPRAPWLVLLAAQVTFGAADSALMTRLAPAIAIAAVQIEQLRLLRLRTEAAEQAVAALGMAQAVLGEDGSVLLADRLWQMLRPQGLAPGEVPIAIPADAPQLARLSDGTAVMLRSLPHARAMVASLRVPPTTLPQGAATALAGLLGLSPREAALAVLLAEGRALIEAGRALRLTDETTRNYSKRIYAKTGAKRQGDLVRIVLTSLAPLA